MSGAPPAGASERPSRPLFRQQALDHHRDARERGDVLRQPPPWTLWAYPVLVVAFACGLLLLVFGRVNQATTAPGFVRVERSPAGPRVTVVALFPPHALPQLTAGQAVTVEPLAGSRGRLLARLTEVGDAAVGPSTVRRALGDAAADALDSGGLTVVARAAVDGDGTGLRDSERCRVEAPLGSERLIVAFVPALRGLWER